MASKPREEGAAVRIGPKTATRAMYLLPNKNIRNLVIKRVERLLPGCNYIVGWRDTNGYGLSLAVVDWLKPGQRYMNL